MSDIDFGRVASLCGVISALAGVGPGFNHISGEAMAELRELNETIRKKQEEQSGRPITPASVGDPESPAQPIPPGGSEGDFEIHPTATQPIDHIDAPDAPEVTHPAPSSEAGQKLAQDNPEFGNPAPAPASEDITPDDVDTGDDEPGLFNDDDVPSPTSSRRL